MSDKKVVSLTEAFDRAAKAEQAAGKGNGSAGKADGPEPGGDANRERLRLVGIPEMDFRGALANLIKGLFGHRQLVLLFGDSGTAKTLIALSMALHIALGWPWCRRKTKHGFVAYVSPEGGDSVHLRTLAWCQYHGVERDLPRFKTVPAAVDLCHDDADVNAIIANIRDAERDLGPCLAVVVDTVSRSLNGGDENGPKDMGAYVSRMDRLKQDVGCTVIALHHVPANGDEPRGHRALRNGSDVRLATTKVSEGLFKLEVRHSRDGQSGGHILFKMEIETLGHDEDGDPICGALVVEAEKEDVAAAAPHVGDDLTPRQERVVQELRKQARERRSYDFTWAEFGDVVVKSGIMTDAENESTRRSIVRNIRVQLANRRLITDDGKNKVVRLLGP